MIRFLNIIFLVLPLGLVAQIPTSLSLSPYSGAERIQFNPALGIYTPYSWDATIAGAHIFAFSDYSFVRKASLLNLGGQISDAVVIDAQGEIPETANVPLILFDLDGGKKEGFLRARLMGPAITFDFKNDMRLGLFSNFRIHGSTSDIPENFGIYELNRSYGTEIIDVDFGTMSAASWLEIGGHFSKRIENISFGANIKYIRGNEGLFIESQTDDNYDFIDSVIITSPIVNFEVAFTNSSINANSYQLDFNGSGIGMDIGVQVELERITAGAAITDIGAIQFRNNVEIYSQEVLQNITTIRTQDYRDFANPRALIDQLQNDLNLTPDLFGVFSIGLPTKLTLHGDYKYNRDISISGVIHQRLPVFKNSMKANNLLVVTPRYDSKWISYFFPLTLYEYKSFRLGAAIRAGPFTIGTDHLASIFIPSDFRGSDVFFSLRLYPFGEEGTMNSRGRSRGLDCPNF